MSEWVEAGKLEEFYLGTVRKLDHGGRTYAVFCDDEARFYCTDGLCTHEYAHLAEGLMTETYIECPLHSGRFDYRTGEPKRLPACDALATYATKVEGDAVFVELG